MLRMDIKGVRAFPLEKEPLTAGRVGLEIAFTFSEDWNDLEKYVVFEGATTKDVALIGEDTCVVPWECLAIAGPSLKVGVYGMRNEYDELVRATPTLWANFGRIESGAVRSKSSSVPPTEDVVTEILRAANTAVDTANEAKDIAEGVAEAAARGDFKGDKGDPGAAATVTVGTTTTGEPGTNASVENVGTSAAAVLNFTIPRGAPGQNGVDGENGSSIWKTDVAPTIVSSVTVSWNISDLNGRIGVEPQVGDLVFYSYYYYEIGRVIDTTVLARHPVNIRGPQGEPGAGGASFVANYTISSLNSVSCDKTYAEIVAAAQNGEPVIVTANGLGLSGQTSNVYVLGTAIYSVLRYDVNTTHQYVIIEHSSQDAISLSFRQDPTVDQQLDSGSTNAISNAAVTAALADKADKSEIPTETSDLTNNSGFITIEDIPDTPSLSSDFPLMDGAADPGISVDAARADHVHPSDTSKLDLDGDAYRAASIPMGQLDGTSTATVMTATVSGITELRDGVCMWLKNGVATSASGFTLNINSLGAKPVYSSLAASTRATTAFNVNYTMLFVYNEDRVTGGCWDMVYGYDTNTTYTPAKLGFGYAECSTAAATAAKTASISSYALTTGGIVAIKFDYDVPANATLNITSKGAKAIYYRGLPITAGVINAKDTVTMIYSTYYHVLSIDRDEAPVTSVNGQTGAVSLSIPSTASDVGAIAAPASASIGDFMCYTANGWDAVTVPSANGVSF